MFEDGKVVRYDVGTGREIAPGGGKVGMGVDEIRSLYAGRVEETPHKYVEDGKYLGVEDISGGKGKLVFATDGDGKVTSWRVGVPRSEEHTSELQSLMRISYAVFCLKKKKKQNMLKHSKT